MALCDVTTVQLNYGTVHKFHKISPFMVTHLPYTLSLFNYIRAKIIVHTFMIELDQLVYWYSTKKKKINVQRQCWRVVLNCWCSITDSGIELPSRECGIQTKLCQITALQWSIQIFSNFYCWISLIAIHSSNLQFGKILLYHCNFWCILLICYLYFRWAQSIIGNGIRLLFLRLQR